MSFSFKRMSVSSTKTESCPRRSLFFYTGSDAMDTAYRVVLPKSSLCTPGTCVQAELLEDENMSWGMDASMRNNKRFSFGFFRR